MIGVARLRDPAGQERGVGRLRENDLRVRALAAEGACHARHGATGPVAAYEVIEPFAREVIEDLDAIQVDRGDLDELFRIKPAAAMDLLTATGRRLRETVNILRHTAARDINEETEDRRTTVMRVADWISAFSGSLPFLAIHVGIFAVWIILNTSPVAQMTGRS